MTAIASDQLPVDCDDIKYLSEQIVAKKNIKQSTMATIDWCSKPQILELSLSVSEQVVHLGRLNLAWITFHQLRR
jgi:hypothetical protein